MCKNKIPLTFLFRRIHSLTGLLLVLFLFEHFITNTQACFFLDEGSGFVKTVNFIQSLPHLQAIELTLIGIPIFFHAILGIQAFITCENNAKKTDGTKPSLMFARNRAYNWQRITAYIVGILLIFHVVQMRFIKHPKKITLNNETYYLIKIRNDENLYKIIEKMDAKIISNVENVSNTENISKSENISNIDNISKKLALENQILEEQILQKHTLEKLNFEKLTSEKLAFHKLSFLIKKFKLKENEIVVMTKQSGEAFLLTIRDVLKNPLMVGIYSIFVLATTFHAINGLWTFLITWGFIISNRSQKISLNICFWIMLFILTLGFVSVWSNLIY